MGQWKKKLLEKYLKCSQTCPNIRQAVEINTIPPTINPQCFLLFPVVCCTNWVNCIEELLENVLHTVRTWGVLVFHAIIGS